MTDKLPSQSVVAQRFGQRGNVLEIVDFNVNCVDDTVYVAIQGGPGKPLKHYAMPLDRWRQLQKAVPPE